MPADDLSTFAAMTSAGTMLILHTFIYKLKSSSKQLLQEFLLRPRKNFDRKRAMLISILYFNDTVGIGKTQYFTDLGLLGRGHAA